MIDINHFPIDSKLDDTNLIFVDSQIENYQSLTANLNHNEVMLLDFAQGGIEQITASLKNCDRVDSISIISHGKAGILQLGSDYLSSDNLEEYRDDFQSWSDSLSPKGDILLYGCSVAAGEVGQEFVESLSQLTNADVAASNDLTGNLSSADWELEISTGAIAEDYLLDELNYSTFEDVLEISEIYNGSRYQLTSEAMSWQEAQAEAEVLGGNLVTINNTAEQQWLEETFGTNEKLWIGLHDSKQEGVFEWQSEETVTYSNWLNSQPDNFQGVENYGVFSWDNNSGKANRGKWNDHGGNGFYRGIIEVATNPGLVGLETSVYYGKEESLVNVTVVRTQGSDGALSIDYDTVDISATQGEDYQAKSGTLTFEDGEKSKTVAVEILADDLAEGKEEIGFTIDNLVGDGTLLAPRTAIISILDDETELEPVINFDNFEDGNQLSLNGNAIIDNGRLQLSSTVDPRSGSSFFEQPIPVDRSTSFSTNFQFQISSSDSGGEGLAFILQNDSNTVNALGDSTQGLGYKNIAPSLAIEFDTLQNNSADINNNHIGIIQNGAVDNVLASADSTFDLNSGDILDAWIDYDGGNKLLSVFLSDTSIKPEQAVLSTQIDLTSIIGEQVLFGFSAGTTSPENSQSINHSILNWQLTTPAPLLPSLSLPEGLTQETVISGLDQPTAIDWTPDGNMLFVAEKKGTINVFQNGELLPTPLVDLSDRVNDAESRGLLDIAIHPDFFNGSPYIYAAYVYDPPETLENQGLAGVDGIGNRTSRLTRFTVDAQTVFTTVVPDSEVVILGKNGTWENFNAFVNSTVDFTEPPAGILDDGSNLEDFLKVDSSIHTIGAVEFGADGFLYVSNGDGGSFNQIDHRNLSVQDLDNLSGKILRIDPITGEGLPDNPFFNGDKNANRSKVYQYGFRNPFRITVHPVTGEVYIGEVGRVVWEEVNSGEPGANFGWPFFEGGSKTTLPIPAAGYTTFPEAQAFYNSGELTVAPILALNHYRDGINAVILGDFYSGNSFPEEYWGDLFFNDLGQGIVRNISFDEAGDITTVGTFATDAENVVHIQQGYDGKLYYVDLDDGLVGRWSFE